MLYVHNHLSKIDRKHAGLISEFDHLHIFPVQNPHSLHAHIIRVVPLCPAAMVRGSPHLHRPRALPQQMPNARSECHLGAMEQNEGNSCFFADILQIN